MLPPAARPGGCASPTLGAPSACLGPRWQGGWVRGRWRPEAAAAGSVGGFGGSQAPRAEEAERRYAELDVPGRRAPCVPCWRSARKAWSDHPSPGRALGDLCSCRQPRAPLGPHSSPGKPRLLRPAWEVRLGRGLRRRAWSGGRRRHLSARLSRRAGPPYLDLAIMRGRGQAGAPEGVVAWKRVRECVSRRSSMRRLLSKGENCF